MDTVAGREGALEGVPGADPYATLRQELEARLQEGVRSPWEAGAFENLALRIFQWQCRHLPALDRFARTRGRDPDRITRWEEIPLVPTAAFRTPWLVRGVYGPERVFLTSGTSLGGGNRGAHPVLDLSLYRASLLPNFMAHLLPEGERMPIVSLVPPGSVAPESSLSFMVDEVAARWGRERDDLFDPEQGLDGARALAVMDRVSTEGRPVLVLTTAFALVLLLDRLEAAGHPVPLPEGSRIMETGGFKGRVRAVPRADLYRRVESALGIPISSIVNEYGMTELLSQFYDGVAGRAPALADRIHRPPPWVRSRVLEPVTLEPVAEGAVGVLAHLDLANLGSVAGVLTEDLARAREGGFELLGRIEGAEARGCSLVAEAFLAALHETR